MPDDIVPVVGDFDGDTRDDILLHHPWGGVDEAWFGADDAVFTAPDRALAPVRRHPPPAGR